MCSRKKNEQEKGKLDEQSNYNVFSFALRHVVAKPPVHCSASQGFGFSWGLQKFQQEVSAMSCSLNEAHVACSDSQRYQLAASLDHCFANQGFGDSKGLQKIQQEGSPDRCSANEASPGCSNSEKCRPTVSAGCPNSTSPTPARIRSCGGMTPHPKWQIVSRSQCQCHQTCR